MATEITLKYLCYIVLSVANIRITQSRNNKLYGANTSGGLWGVSLSETADGLADTIRNAGYSPDEYNKHITSVSYDPLSHRMLFETENPHAISLAPLCSKRADPPRIITHIESPTLHDPAMGDCVNCRTSAFTLYGSRIYFLLTGEYFASNGNIHRIAQIRYMMSCDQCRSNKPVEDYKYVDTVSCSRVVAEVFHYVFDAYTIDDIEIMGAQNMKVHENDDGTLDFFFHFGNITRSDSQPDQVTLSLWHASSDGTARALTHEMIGGDLAAWRPGGLGSVDYKDGTLCWTAGYTIRCADFSLRKLRNQQMLMEAGGGLLTICTGKTVEYISIVSGIAILRGGDHRVVAFGCSPYVPGEGGVGIMRVGRTEENGEISPVVNADGDRLMAGSLFSHRALPKKCDFGDDLPICLATPPETTEAPPEVTSARLPDEVLDEGHHEDEAGYEIPSGNAIDNGQTGKEVAKPVSDRESEASAVCASIIALLLPLLTASLFC